MSINQPHLKIIPFTIHINGKLILLHTAGEVICSVPFGDRIASKDITVEDYFKLSKAGLSALHTNGYECNYPKLTGQNKYLTVVKQKQYNEPAVFTTPRGFLRKSVSMLVRIKDGWTFEQRTSSYHVI